MKSTKPCCFLIIGLFLIANLCNATSTSVANGVVTVLTSKDTLLPKPVGPLTQSYLMGVTRFRDIKEFSYFIPEERLKQYHTYNVLLSAKRKNGDQYSQPKYDGKLIAICDSGVFLYKTKKRVVRYYPYRVIWTMSKGVVTSKAVGYSTLGGAAVGLIAGPAIALDPVEGATGGFFLGATYGLLGSVYYILGRGIAYKFSKVKYVAVFAQTANGIAYHAKAIKYSAYFRNIDLLAFPLGDTSGMSKLLFAAVPVKLNHTDSVVSDSQRLDMNVQSSVLIVDLKDTTDVKPVPAAVERKSLGAFETSKGYSSQWMMDGYMPDEVRTTYLSNQFAWVRQKAITTEDLKKLKSKSEIQFVAMWITTAAGYSFREAVSFNKEQLSFIQPKEPYLAETVVKGSVIDPMVLLVVDVENLKVLYQELQRRQ